MKTKGGQVKREEELSKLTKEQEMQIMHLLVLGVNPNASEELIRKNQNEYYAARVRKEKAYPTYPGYPRYIILEANTESAYLLGPYRSGPGGWTLSNKEKKETLQEIKGEKEKI